MAWRYLKLNATIFLHSVDVHDSFNHPLTWPNMHATNLKRFLEDILTEKVVLMGGDNLFYRQMSRLQYRSKHRYFSNAS